MTKLMTKRQGWALFCITKKDYRKENLTYDQASELIKTLGNPNYVKKSANIEDIEAVKIHREAVEAGMNALKNAEVIPMVVQEHVNMIDDNSPVAKQWVVEGGVCGFAWISFKANTKENRKFLAGLKKAGLAGEDKYEKGNIKWGKSYKSGFQYWVSQGGQSMQKKEAFAHAFAEVLHAHGITAYAGSRMD
jgi:hypothetical protein